MLIEALIRATEIQLERSQEVIRMKIAIIGSGIAGLACACRLTQDGCDVSLFETNDYFGGHAHNVDVIFDGITHDVDIGFLPFNHRT